MTAPPARSAASPDLAAAPTAVRPQPDATAGEDEPLALLRELCHELRTPVSAIAALSGALHRPGADARTRAEAAELLGAHAAHVQALLDAVAGLVAPGCEERPAAEEVWLPRLLRGALHAAGCGEDAVVAVDRAARAVRLDATALRQIVTNLAENARCHGGTAAVEVRVRRRADGLALVVADRGPGHDGPGPDGPLGWGVGLRVVRRLVARMGGSVAVAARHGGGLAVTVLVPLGA